ncbi:macrophage mannose receptor 1-like isoform X1 [Gambusia affinis]|uniref:macrophage mannose receptor 1-like isoform X1 n=1 Tax=Gambusia affinis TaxID=33528 RepID=UPI001CDB7947|nr:macrophage mannose receptor 1-like isoform X1 [Gambusia affinis]
MNQQIAWITLILHGFCLGSCLQVPLRKYYYVNQFMTWPKAQQFCREHYTDLATFESMDDINRLKPNISYSWAWIGLWDDPNAWKTAMGNEPNSWRWSATGETSKTGYQSWGTGEPNFKNPGETCTFMANDGYWYDSNCESGVKFICYNVTENNVKQYVLISTLATWSSAQSYCRSHHTDLAMIENKAENSEVKQLIPTGFFVWIGLYRVPWSWSDKSPSLFRRWGPSEPDNGGIQHCVCKNTAHLFGDERCDDVKVFICEQVVKTSTTVKMTMTSDVDLTDPAVNAQVLQQLGALLTNQGWTDFKVQWKIVSKKNKEN